TVKDGSDATPAAGKVTVTALTATATAGEYTMTLKGTLAGTYTVTPMLNGSAIRDDLKADVTLTAGTTPDGALSTFAANPVSVVADNSAASTLTLTLKDTFGNSISGLAGSLTLDVKDSLNAAPATGDVTVTALTATGTAGEYTATLKGKKAGAYTVKPVLNGSVIDADLKATVTLTAGAAVNGDLSAEPASAPADNTPVTLTLAVTDANGNAVPDLTNSLSFTVTDSADAPAPVGKVEVTDVKAKDGEPGTYTATLKGTLAGVWTVKALNSDVQLTGASTGVTLVAGDPDATQSTISTSPKTIKADNTEGSTITIVLKDTYGNAVSGYGPAGTDSLGIYVENSSGARVTTNITWGGAMAESATSPGTYTRILKGRVVDTLTVKPTISDEPLSNLSDTVELQGAPFKDVTVNGKTFGVGNGFPTTGFADNGSIPGSVGTPTFTLNIPSGALASTYTWTSNQNWASVSSSGVVTFNATGPTSATKKVTITAMPSGSNQSLVYRFTVGTWYKLRGNDGATWSAGNTYCASLGAAMPSVAQLTSGANVRQIGSLWGEWGNLIKPPYNGYSDTWYKTTSGASGNHTIVNADDDGRAIDFTDNENAGVGTACFITL
ncbi:hypothetical protein D8W73_24395, partial [Citrobacter amalonaticus]|nr:hypothetical protein [Citrobacter amalonaticus]